jgi:hypothetical protein
MALSTGILANDLKRMAAAGPMQLGARVAPPGSEVYAEDEFRRTHNGMDRLTWDARQKMLAHERFEEQTLTDLDGAPPPVDGLPSGLSSKRRAYASYAAWLRGEESKFDALEAKRRELQAIVDAPADVESTLRGMLRRTADALLHGTPADESDAAKRLELDAKLATQKHRAEAAQVALSEIEPQIEVAQIRVSRLRDREMEFLSPCLFEAAEGIARTLARVRAEVAALEQLLQPLEAHFRVYGSTDKAPEPPDVSVKWRHSWHDVADALAADPTADVSKLLPVVKF